MKSAVRVLAVSRCSGRKIAVLGDMLELGDESERQHFGVGVFAANQDIDILVAVGKDASEIARGASEGKLNTVYFKEKDEFIREMGSIISSGDLILVKGSRGMRMEQIVEELMNY